jgi:hypothetical protein
MNSQKLIAMPQLQENTKAVVLETQRLKKEANKQDINDSQTDAIVQANLEKIEFIGRSYGYESKEGVRVITETITSAMATGVDTETIERRIQAMYTDRSHHMQFAKNMKKAGVI